MKDQFNITRLGHFLKRQLYFNISSMWVAIAAIAGALIFISALVTYFSHRPIVALAPWYAMVFFIGGNIFAASIFNEMHAPQKSYAFLTLPVSALEKLAAAWLITVPLFILTVGLGMIAMLSLVGLIAGQMHEVQELFAHDIPIMLKIFAVVQSIFLLGATTFRGNNFLKTHLAIFLTITFLAGFSVLLVYVLTNKTGIVVSGESGEFKDTVKFIFEQIMPYVVTFVLGPYLLVVAYFKLKERQV
ncbi:hypothetical protein [Pontibacter arcticus]|uniref:Uncharacterized protein n=1 Tax=Pontibacter arcticus TaxID=2080288 RepID=A0A364RBE9_9BACT|nr:hypothetical protein [Pontibacter arcticus]RAU81567.1 hypothetical protein DP923_15815 [Pontibacter arcticus]